MNAMQNAFNAVGCILLLGSVGAGASLLGLLRDEHLPLLSNLVIKVALPCMIVNNVLGQYTPESLAKNLPALAAALLSVLLTLLLALSFFFGKYGSLWIDRLYLKNHSILSFPDAVGSRARYRVKLLTLLFFLTGIRLFFVSQGIILVLSLALCGLLLLIIATDFEQYCIFNDMIIPLAAGGVLCCALFLVRIC